MISIFDLAREGFLLSEIDFDTATIKASLVRGATINLATMKFMSDIAGAGGSLVATQTLASKTGTAGVADAADLTFPTVGAGAAIERVILYQASAVGGGADVAASAQRVILNYDGIVPVTCAANAASGATSIAIDPLMIPLASGSTVVFGGVTATLTGLAAAGARTLTVSATSGTIAAGVVGLSSGQGGFPITPTGVDINVTLDNGSNKIFKL